MSQLSFSRELKRSRWVKPSEDAPRGPGGSVRPPASLHVDAERAVSERKTHEDDAARRLEEKPTAPTLGAALGTLQPVMQHAPPPPRAAEERAVQPPLTPPLAPEAAARGAPTAERERLAYER